jgi:hypothetical protein
VEPFQKAIDSELFGHEKALLLEQQALVKVILKWLTEQFSLDEVGELP